MIIIKRRSAQLSVAAVAALAIFAVAAVMLLAGSTPAQATTAAITPDDGAAQERPQQTDPAPTPTPAPPPPCPGEAGNPNAEAARVVDSGHIALFDVWWNPEELELTNSSCPPTVTYVDAKYDDDDELISPGRYDRSPSNIDIAKTIIHIPNSAKITLNEEEYPKGAYEALWNADAKENRDINKDGTPDHGWGDGIVWALPACPPEEEDPLVPMCISISAALLNQDDWVTPSGARLGKIEYLLDHVHQIDIDKQDPRYVLAYDGVIVRWDSSDVREAKISVAPGKYENLNFFFTDRGTYEFQVHIGGYPKNYENPDPLSEDNSVSSDVRTYIIHVGAEADLGVTATATPPSPVPGDTVTVTIAASNHGPDEVPATGVDVTLPPGLTYASHVAPTGTDYASATGVWTIGELAKNASKTLTVKATVDAETRGQELTVKAAISGTETLTITETNDQSEEELKKYPVPVADPNSANDTDTDDITVPTSSNTPPMFTVTRSIAGNSAAGTSVGDPVGVKDPNSGDTLTFTLTGTGADQFTASPVSGGAQIAVANGASLDPATKSTYDLVLGVSDGKDANGNTDPSVDATIGVHYLTGPAFVLWLVAIGVMLVTGRVEKRFAALVEDGPSE